MGSVGAIVMPPVLQQNVPRWLERHGWWLDKDGPYKELRRGAPK